MLIATAGNDHHDIIKEANIITEARKREEPVTYPYQAAVTASLNNHTPAREEVPEHLAEDSHDAIIATPWETGIKWIQNTISKYSKKITQRSTLMTGMPASNYDSWRTWGLKLKEHGR